MYTAKIKDIKRDVYQHNQEPFLDVEVEILNAEGEVVDTRKYGYAADTPEEHIVADLERMLTTYVSDLENAEKSKDADALNAVADKTIESLKDAEIGMPEAE
jgi:hypothetical protein